MGAENNPMVAPEPVADSVKRRRTSKTVENNPTVAPPTSVSMEQIEAMVFGGTALPACTALASSKVDSPQSVPELVPSLPASKDAEKGETTPIARTPPVSANVDSPPSV